MAVAMDGVEAGGGEGGGEGGDDGGGEGGGVLREQTVASFTVEPATTRCRPCGKKCRIFLRAKGAKQTYTLGAQGGFACNEGGQQPWACAHKKRLSLARMASGPASHCQTAGEPSAEGRCVRKAPTVALGVEAAESQAPVRRPRPGEHPRPGQGERAAYQEGLNPGWQVGGQTRQI